MGFFNNVKNIKDKALESGYIQEIEELQGVFDKIDEQADIERENKRAEREHFESLSIDEKVEYKRIQKRNKRIKRLGLYGLTVAGMATGVGIPVLMAANVGAILSDDDLTFDQDSQLSLSFGASSKFPMTMRDFQRFRHLLMWIPITWKRDMKCS